ncbi:MAG: hypothetical protein FWC00_00235 [Firmicutes bacterium]|nr:hypothetical protein [Bacillota bacterium]
MTNVDAEQTGFSRKDIENKVGTIRANAEKLLEDYNARAVVFDPKEIAKAETGYVQGGTNWDGRGFMEDILRPMTQVEVNRVMVNLQQNILEILDAEKNPELNSGELKGKTVMGKFGSTVNGFKEHRNVFSHLLYHNILANDTKDWGGNNSSKGKLLYHYADLRRDDYESPIEQSNSMTRALKFLNSHENGCDHRIDGIKSVYCGFEFDRDGNHSYANKKREREIDTMVKNYDIKGLTEVVENLLVGALPNTWGNETERRNIIRQYGDLTELVECVKMHQKIHDKGFQVDLSTPEPEL